MYLQKIVLLINFLASGLISVYASPVTEVASQLDRQQQQQIIREQQR